MRFVKIITVCCLLAVATAIVCCHNAANTPVPPPDTSVPHNPDTPAPVSNVLAERGYSLMTETTIDSAFASKIIVVQIGDTGTLAGSIIQPAQPANIRFNQVIDPSGKADGPFGKYMTYKVTATGSYQIIIASSRMAENPYTGKLKTRLVLQ